MIKCCDIRCLIYSYLPYMINKTKLKKLNYSDDDIKFIINYCKKNGGDGFLIEVIWVENYIKYINMCKKTTKQMIMR